MSRPHRSGSHHCPRGRLRDHWPGGALYLYWAHDGTAMDEVVEFLADGRNVLAVRFDAQRLIASDEVRSLWQTIAWHRPSPGDGGARAWLASIVSACDAWLADNGAPPVTKVDTCPADEALTQRVGDEAQLRIGVEPSSSPDVTGWATTREHPCNDALAWFRQASPSGSWCVPSLCTGFGSSRSSMCATSRSLRCCRTTRNRSATSRI